MTGSKTVAISPFSLSGFTLLDIITMIILYSFLIVIILLMYFKSNWLENVFDNISNKIFNLFKK